MNLAALVSGPVVDGFNIGLQNGVDVGKHRWTGNRLVIFTCTLSNVLSLWVTWRCMREVKVTDSVTMMSTDEGGPEEDDEKHMESGSGVSRRGGVRPGDDDLCGSGDVEVGDYIEEDEEDASTVCTTKGQHQYQGMKGRKTAAVCTPPEGGGGTGKGSSVAVDPCVSTGAMSTMSPFYVTGRLDDIAEPPTCQTCVKESTVEVYVPQSQHPCITIQELVHSPTFWRFAALTLLLVNLHAIFRHLDATLPTYLVRCFGSDVPKGTLYSINPFMIIFLTPSVAAVTNTYNHFNMIKWGGYLTAASPFFPAMSTSIWAVVCMNVLLSLGN